MRILVRPQRLTVNRDEWDDAIRKYREDALARADRDIKQAEDIRQGILKMANLQVNDPIWGPLDVYQKGIYAVLGRRAIRAVPCPPGTHFSLWPNHSVEERDRPHGNLYVYSCDNDRRAYVGPDPRNPSRWEIRTGDSRSEHGFDLGWSGAITKDQAKEAGVYWVEKGRYYWDDVLDVSNPHSPYYDTARAKFREELK